jgi:trigger factor
MTTALARLSGSAFELTITVPWAEVKRVYDLVFDELAGEIEVEGFRKGKAPKELAAARIDKNKIYGEVINRLLPETYQKALAEHGLKPIVAPRVRLKEAQEDRDWQFLVHAAEKPKVDLDGYKEAAGAINAKGKIWTPGGTTNETKDRIKDNGYEIKEKDEQEKGKRITEIIDKLLEVCKVELAEILLEAETNRLMAQLVDDVRAAGLTFEQYLASSQQTAPAVQAKYHRQAETALKLEFILEAVAEDLKIQVEPAEIEAIIAKEPTPERQKALREQAYLLASAIRRDKVLTRLLAL